MKSTVVQDNSWYTGLASREQARRVSGWRRERKWEMAELKGRRWEGKLQFHSYLV